MKYKVKKESEFEKNIEISINFDDLEDKKSDAISKISKSLKVKGFRPGKIPSNIVIREVGEDYILEESVDLYLPEKIFEILKSEEINPATRPVIKELKKEKNSFKVDVSTLETHAPADAEPGFAVLWRRCQLHDPQPVLVPAKWNELDRGADRKDCLNRPQPPSGGCLIEKINNTGCRLPGEGAQATVAAPDGRAGWRGFPRCDHGPR